MSAYFKDENLILARALAEGPAPTVITDEKANIVYVNARFTELTGYTAEEVLGQNPRIFSAGKTPESVYQILWDTLRKGQVWTGDLLNKRKNGEIFWESIVISPLKNENGEISHYVGIWRDVSLERIRENDLKHDSITDALTGIYNRRHILEELEKEIERASRYNHKLAGIMADVDNFKLINNHYGHLIGDKVLITFAKTLKHSIRKIDIVGRYGGDEFLIILPESDLRIATLVAERMRKMLKTYEWNVLSELGPVTGSFGLFSFQDMKQVSKTDFIEKIDAALLAAKNAGKDRIIIGD